MLSATVTVNDPKLTISQVENNQNDRLVFQLELPDNTTAGLKTLNFSTVLGSTTADLNTIEKPPIILFSPTSILTYPGAPPIELEMRLNRADLIDQTIGLSVHDDTIASLTPGSITFSAGQTQALQTVYITPLATGVTELILNTNLRRSSPQIIVTDLYVPQSGVNQFQSATIGLFKGNQTSSAPIDVESMSTVSIGLFKKSSSNLELEPINLHSTALGLSKGSSTNLPTTNIEALQAASIGLSRESGNASISTVDGLVSALVGIQKNHHEPLANLMTDIPSKQLGIVRGAVLTGVSPSQSDIGETLTLSIQGQYLQTVTEVVFEPSAGMLVSDLDVAADGESLSFTLNITPDSTQSLHRIQLLNTTGSFIPVVPFNAGYFTVLNQQARQEFSNANYLQMTAYFQPLIPLLTQE